LVFARIDALGLGNVFGKLPPAGVGAAPGAFVYRYDAPVTRGLEVRFEGPYAAEQGLALAVFDRDGNPVTPVAEGARPVGRLRVNVAAGFTYYVQVSAPPAQTDFAVTFADFGEDAATAYPLAFPPTATSVSQDGAIDPVGVRVFFSFVAPVSGTLTSRLHPTTGSPLVGALDVYDAAENPLGSDVGPRNGTPDRVVPSVVVRAGQTDFVVARASDEAGSGQTSGGYLLTLTVTPTREVGHDIPNATPRQLSPVVPTVIRGAVADPGPGRPR